MKSRSNHLLLAFLLVTVRLAADWPQFRGPDGQGHSAEKGIPIHWAEDGNITWKTAVPGQGWSSPVIAGKQVWMTSAGAEGKSLHAVCISSYSGLPNNL